VTAVTESVHTALQTDMAHLGTSARVVVRGTGTSPQLLSVCFHISACQSVMLEDCEVLQ